MAKRIDYESYIDYRRAVVRESQKRRRAKAAEDGLCEICCIRKPEKGYHTCRECIERIKGNQKQARAAARGSRV